MATVSFSIVNPNEGSSWSGSFTVTNPTGSISYTRPVSASVSSTNFIVNQFDIFDEYVTWRSVDISGQTPGPPNFLNVYPTSGYSIDIWSPSLIIDIVTNRNWNYLNGRSYPLNPDKNTLIYNYDSVNPIYYSRGGNISFTIA